MNVDTPNENSIVSSTLGWKKLLGMGDQPGSLVLHIYRLLEVLSHFSFK
jgi:hypothetical protein